MTRRELNLFEMFRTLEEFFDLNLSSFENKPAIHGCITELKSRNATIATLNGLQSVSTKADFAIKNEDKLLLIDTAVKISDGLKVLAATNKDTRLKIEAQLSHWDLGRLKEPDLEVRLRQLHATAIPYGAELLPLGITMEEIDSLDTDTDKLMKTSPTIKNIKVKTKQATTELGQTVVDTNNFIRQTIDSLMLQFKTLDATLYGEYQNARKIIDRTAGRTTKPEAPEAK
jgi:hypothetical protein